MKDMRAVRANEKIKRLSTILGAGGIALLVTTLLRWNDTDLSPAIAAWILMSAVVIFVSVQMNELLEPEEEE